MAIFFLFFTSKKVRGPEAEKSANRTGSGRGKGPNSKSDCPDLRGLSLGTIEYEDTMNKCN